MCSRGKKKKLRNEKRENILKGIKKFHDAGVKILDTSMYQEDEKGENNVKN